MKYASCHSIRYEASGYHCIHIIQSPFARGYVIYFRSNASGCGYYLRDDTQSIPSTTLGDMRYLNTATLFPGRVAAMRRAKALFRELRREN